MDADRRARSELNEPRYKTWFKDRSVRFAAHDHAEHLPYPVIIHAARGMRPSSDSRLAQVVRRELTTLTEVRGSYLSAHCLMPNPMHILMSPADSGLSLGHFVGQFKGKTTHASWNLG